VAVGGGPALGLARAVPGGGKDRRSGLAGRPVSGGGALPGARSCRCARGMPGRV